MSVPARSPIRLIDPRGQRFGAGASAVVLVIATAFGLPIVVAVVAVTLGVSSALGTRYFLFGRPWPAIRSRLALTAPAVLEPEVGPRFAQALGTVALVIGLAGLVAGSSLGWIPVAIVIALQATLALSGYCLGCRIYGLQWWLPDQFDRLVIRRSS